MAEDKTEIDERSPEDNPAEGNSPEEKKDKPAEKKQDKPAEKKQDISADGKANEDKPDDKTPEDDKSNGDKADVKSQGANPEKVGSDKDEIVVDIEHLKKSFGKSEILKDINLKIKRGETIV
ncbi:MAG: hypothetical protein JNK43_00415, partial [Ignavibacteria bacterium]|nr:hypothetical protein [Ignavibacteria bacterium]